MINLSNKTQASFWTVKEIVEYTGLSESTVWRLLSSKKLGSIKLKGSRKIRHTQLVEFLGFDPLNESERTESILRNKSSQSATSKDKFPLLALIEADSN